MTTQNLFEEFKNDPACRVEWALFGLTESICKLHPNGGAKIRIVNWLIEKIVDWVVWWNGATK